MMNELKPEDVMEEAECCGYATGCTDCVLARYDGSPCIVKKALALLREKDAQISPLQYQADFWDKHAKLLDETISIQQKEIAEKDAEIERLTIDLKAMRAAANSYKMALIETERKKVSHDQETP